MQAAETAGGATADGRERCVERLGEPDSRRSSDGSCNEVLADDLTLFGRDLALQRHVLVSLAIVALRGPHVSQCVLHLHGSLLAKVEVSLVGTELEENREVARLGLELKTVGSAHGG